MMGIATSQFNRTRDRSFSPILFQMCNRITTSTILHQDVVGIQSFIEHRNSKAATCLDEVEGNMTACGHPAGDNKQS